MNPPEAIISAYFDDALTPEQLEALGQWIQKSETHALHFTRRAFEHQGLRDHYSGEKQCAVSSCKAGATSAARPAQSRRGHTRRPSQRISWGAAAVAAMLVFGVVWFINARVSAKPHLGVLVEQVGATWTAGSPAMNDGDKLYGQRLELLGGLVKIRMNGGAELIVEAPAELILQTGSDIYLHHGKVVATCRDRAKGFTVNTNSITVVDIGTEFGIQTDSKINTVAVFQGAVELHQPDEKRTSAKPVRLVAGQGVTADEKGTIEPLAAAALSKLSREFHRHTTPLITSVVSSSKRKYCIRPGGMREGVKAFTDRDYEWKGVPGYLLDGDLIQPANNDKDESDLNVRVRLSRPARVYVVFLKTQEKPAWMDQRFVLQPEAMRLDCYLEGTRVLDKTIDGGAYGIWELRIPRATAVRFGATGKPSFRGMYGIVVVEENPA